MKKFSLIQKNRITLALLLSFLLFLSNGFFGCSDDDSSKQTPAVTPTEIQSVVDAAMAAATVKAGISVAVYKDGNSMWTYAAGKASEGVAMTTSTPTYAYSITKTFVSALVLTQIENEDYTLDATVDSLLSSDTDYADVSEDVKTNSINENATVEQLLEHTSGMPDYASNLTALIPLCNPANTWKPADILEDIVYLDYGSTGTFEYSNLNYVLLGMIAEENGGDTLNDLLDTAFFTPLAIGALLSPQDTIPSNIAHPYDDAHILSDLMPEGTFLDFSVAITSFVDPTYDIYLGMGRGSWAAGAIIATAEDLAIWGYELYSDSGIAISSTVRSQIKNSATTHDDYGYGVTYRDFTYDDTTEGGTYGHGGGSPGYKTLLRYETTRDIAVAIITNQNNYGDFTGLVNLEELAEDLLNEFGDN